MEAYNPTEFSKDQHGNLVISKVKLFTRNINDGNTVSILDNLTIQAEKSGRMEVIGRVSNVQEHLVADEMTVFGTIIFDANFGVLKTIMTTGIEVCLLPTLAFTGDKHYRATHWQFLHRSLILGFNVVRPVYLDFSNFNKSEDFKHRGSVSYAHRRPPKNAFLEVNGREYTEEEIINIVQFYEAYAEVHRSIHRRE